MKSPLDLGIPANLNFLMYFHLYKAANFYKIPQEIWLTLSRFTGRQEKKDALVLDTIRLISTSSIYIYFINLNIRINFQQSMVSNSSFQRILLHCHFNFSFTVWKREMFSAIRQKQYCCANLLAGFYLINFHHNHNS